MMAAYPPGNNMHPGLPHGHPGMAPTPNQHMGQQMQMHAGVSGPPHVSQPGAMMGMQPGAVGGMQPGANGMGGQHPGAGMGMPGQGMGAQNMPGAQGGMHPMGHMTPQQAQQLMQQQQLQANSNPALMAQLQQQQQHMIRQRMMQQAQTLGIPVQQMQGMNQQQLQQLFQQQQNQQAFGNNQQQVGPVQLPAHLAQQQMQVRQQQSQQQAMIQQQQQAQQQQAQQQQQQAQQQQMAMQHANSQQSNQGQPGPPPQSVPPGHPGQMRPASRMQNPNEQNQAGQQAPHPQSTPQQNQPPQAPQLQQQQSQQGSQPTPQATPQQGGQQQNTPSQPPAPQNQPQSQAQQGGQQQVQQGQQPQSQQQQQQMMAQRQQQIAMMQRNQQMAAQRMAQQAAQQNQQLSGQYILRLLSFSDKLSSFCHDEGEKDGRNLANWQDFIDRQFMPDGRLTLAPYELGKKVEMPRATLARFFWMYFETGASALRLHTEHGNETMLPDGRCRLSCSNATLTVSYPNGARVEMSGPLFVLFGSVGSLIEGMEFQMTKCEEHLSRSEVEKVLANMSPTLSNKQSPKMTKGKIPKAQQKLQQQQENATIEQLPKAPKGQGGMTMRMLQFLEISETMGLMQDLMLFAQEKNLRPTNALDQLASEYERTGASNPQINLPPGQSGTPNGMPPGAQGTPRMGNMPMPGQPGFQGSPSVPNMNLPMQPNGIHSSPHLQHGLAPGQGPGGMGTPSPAQTHMAAPPMMPQHSQQGTSSSASANTSPQVNNKRRRSTVKVEGDDVEHKVKPSPRMPKKPKPN